MEKKFTVFVCSTFSDLRDERQQIFNQLYRLRCIPIGMEGFAPAHKGQMQNIRERIDECDYFVVIVAHRYGTLAPESETSITEYEYEYALNHRDNKPIARFVIDREADWKKEREAYSDGRDLEKLEAFKMRLKESPANDFYDLDYWNRENLIPKVTSAVQSMIAGVKRPGLVVPAPILDDATQIGVDRIFSGLRRVDKREAIAAGHKELKIILNDGYNFLDANAELIDSALKKGTKIDILLVHPETPCLPAIASKSVKTVEIQRGDIMKGIQYIRKNFQNNPLVRARMHKQYNTYSAFINESYCLVDFYFNFNLGERRQDDRVALQCNAVDGGLYFKIYDDFDNFWRSLDYDESANILQVDE